MLLLLREAYIAYENSLDDNKYVEQIIQTFNTYFDATIDESHLKFITEHEEVSEEYLAMAREVSE